jgi:DNA polymerase-3 subunit chi
VTKVTFYFNAKDKLRAACQLSHKAMQNGLRVHIHTPSAEVIGELDKLLWQYPATAFMPHCLSSDAGARDMPVVLGHDESFPHSELLISLHAACPPFFSRFARVIEIVGQEEEDVKQGRARYTFYRDRGYELNHFDLLKRAD